MKSKMKLHPFNDCVKRAVELHLNKGADFFQQWNCAHCGVKQTMPEPNRFWTRGLCEECGKETNIEHDGCNYMVLLGGASTQILDYLKGKIE